MHKNKLPNVKLQHGAVRKRLMANLASIWPLAAEK
jgi:hypothetical protein